jgi:hypothetical protein
MKLLGSSCVTELSLSFVADPGARSQLPSFEQT